MVEIIKNFKAPEKSKTKQYLELYNKMEPGDAFLVDEKERQVVQQSAYRYKVRISVRKQPDGSLAVIRL
jgi:hypothetical protein